MNKGLESKNEPDQRQTPQEPNPPPPEAEGQLGGRRYRGRLLSAVRPRYLILGLVVWLLGMRAMYILGPWNGLSQSRVRLLWGGFVCLSFYGAALLIYSSPAARDRLLVPARRDDFDRVRFLSVAGVLVVVGLVFVIVSFFA